MSDAGTPTGRDAPPRPRALFLSADLPWPRDGGGRIATLRLLESMCRRYDVDLVAMADRDGEPDLAYLRSICREVEVVRIPFTFGRHRLRQSIVFGRSVLSTQPYRLRKFADRRFAAAVRRRFATATYDLLHFDQLGTVPYHALAPAGLPTTMAHHNVESDIYRLAVQQARNPLRRILASLEERKLRRVESVELARFDRIFALAPDDAALLARLGIDRTTTLPMPAPASWPPRGAPGGHTILSLGSMSWYGVTDGLLWFHDEVLPRVRARVPDVAWELVGPYAPAAIRRLGDEEGITVAGYAPDIEPHIAAARVAIVPVRIAGGIRIKLLECLAWGLPAVSTGVGARGLEFSQGEGGFRHDDAAGFADAVAALLTDDSLWESTAERGRQFVARCHSVGRFDEVVQSGIQAAMDYRARRVAGIGR